jgi:hypothetical protein
MSKGQYLIVQFLLFFLIGLGIFLAFGNIFRLRADSLKENIAYSARKLISSYISSVVINSYDTCKGCDFVTTSVRIENETADYFHEIELIDGSGLKILSQPGGKNYTSSIHNLDSTLILSGKSTSIKPIILTLENKNKLLEAG